MSTLIIDGKEVSYHELERLVCSDQYEDASDSDGSEKEDGCENDDVEEDLQDCVDEEYVPEPELSISSDDEQQISEPGPSRKRRKTTENVIRATIPEWFEKSDTSVLIPRMKTVKGKNNCIWSTSHKPQRKTASRNIVRTMPGPKGKAKQVSTQMEAFDLFFDTEMLEDIVKFTNQEIERQRQNYSREQSWTRELTLCELKAYIGLLYISGARKDNHMKTQFLWSSLGSPLYAAVMPMERFRFITNCLRFDDKQTRDGRKAGDPFTNIRSLWDTFIAHCTEYYTPSVECTIDEQLLGFRGRCLFRMYIPNKPEKYGIKLVLMCDSHSYYLVSGIPYIGKQTNTDGRPLGQYFVEELSKPIHGTNSNITVDNWFTSFPLLTAMLERGITMVGTLRKNKPEIPKEMLVTKNRPVYTTIFLYNEENNHQLLSFHQKKGKVVLLASTMHDSPTVSVSSNKPEAIEFYNSTKGGVDTFDQLCKNYSCSRRTRRWPLAVFYGLLNAAGINAFVIWTIKNASRGNKQQSRLEFLHNLGLDLATPFMQSRLTRRNIQSDLRMKIESVLKENNTLIQQQQQQQHQHQRPQLGGPKQGRCKLCKRSTDKKYAVKCSICSQFICGEHRNIICSACKE